MNLIWIGFGLMMVFEGIPYFCFPNQIKQLARKLPEVENSVLRWIGLALMLIGLAVVHLAMGAIQNNKVNRCVGGMGSRSPMDPPPDGSLCIYTPNG